jgi:hypothetical protein
METIALMGIFWNLKPSQAQNLTPEACEGNYPPLELYPSRDRENIALTTACPIDLCFQGFYWVLG